MLENEIKGILNQLDDAVAAGTLTTELFVLSLRRLEEIAERVGELERQAVPPHLRGGVRPRAPEEHNVVSLLAHRERAARTVS